MNAPLPPQFWQGCFIVWTENLKALKARLRKGMLYVEMGRAHPPEYPYPPFEIMMEKIFHQRRAKQQCDNLINRLRRNPYLIQLGTTQ